MGDMHPLMGLALLSEVVAVWLVWRLWRSTDALFFKISLTLLAWIPLLGPLMVFWIGNFPSSKPMILRDMAPRRTDFYDRWRHVLEARSPHQRFRGWHQLMTRHRDEEP
jgi:hypothetical protein